MPKKEDRSDWVAVEAEFAGSSGTEIQKALSAYQFFQRDQSAAVRDQITDNGALPFDLAAHGRAMRDRWKGLSDEEREVYNAKAREDSTRFARESHAADVAAMERRARLQAERNALPLWDEDDNTGGSGTRTTRGKREKIQRKKAKAERKKKRTRNPDDEEFDDEEEDEDEGSYQSGESDDDSDDDSEEGKAKKKKATSAPRRAPSAKQVEHRAKVAEEKRRRDAYVAERHEDLRREKSGQAKKRLEFLLKQSNIFSHFGSVKQDTAKFGIKSAQKSKEDVTEGTSRRSNANDDEDDALEEADATSATYLTAQPSTLGFGKMRQYQLEGLNWMVGLQENGVNGILADEMGLGKTLQSISVLVYMLEYRKNTGPHLVVVPKSTLSNWMNEFARWAPTIKAVKFHGDKEERERIATEILQPGQRDEERSWNAVVTTYEICNIEKTVLNKFAWTYLIIDEAHRLKNEASTFSQTIRQFETQYRLLLTGTPLQNSLHELWALLNFLVPDVFESAEQFDEWFNLDIEDNDEKNKLISQLHKILRPFMLRRLKADVETSLPPKHETILFTGMSAVQKKLYRDILIRDIDAIQGRAGNRSAVLNIVMQLRKCAGHPYLFPGVEDRSLPPLGEHLVENCGKMVLLDKLLKRLRERGHRVLLFTQMTKVLDIMEDYLVLRRFPYCRIDGNTSYDLREEYIDAFNKPDSDRFIFLLSTRAGGLGINLQTADVVILYDSDWNPQADLQAQDRAHRIGQKKPVQIFRLVTEHTVEEKIVERAQQKLKLDAMVVQQGRLNDKDKLSKDELLTAIRFGADKIFKSSDSSITDDDIDLILDAGKRKTEELNEKLKSADKGDMLDFKLDGSSVQTFEGVDYSKNALAQAQAEADLLGVFSIGKRERREANYNENSLYQRQINALQGEKKPKKKKEAKLPKNLRLPRMEEWQMYDREALTKIHEEVVSAFKNLPEDQQKMATGVKTTETKDGDAENLENENETPFELPPLISPERQAEKDRLLSEGFSDWNRSDYNSFVKASARYGRDELDKIALEVGKPETAVRQYAAAFWNEVGKSRINEHEYDRAIKAIERGEKKIGEIKAVERGTRVLVEHFANPWDELEFFHAFPPKDKMFTAEEDRHLLCWARKYGYGQWQAIQLAIRRNPKFRFDYFLRSLPIDALGKRCEQLMKAAEKEVEQLEKKAREEAGLPTEPESEGQQLPPIQLPKFHVVQRQRRLALKAKIETEKSTLESKVAEIEAQIKAAQTRLRELNEGSTVALVTSTPGDESPTTTKVDRAVSPVKSAQVEEHGEDDDNGAVGPEGSYVEFPEYDGSEAPADWKKPFTHYCTRTRKDVKASLDPSERKDKQRINGILRERWLALSEDDKQVFRDWSEWDKKRHTRDMRIFEGRVADRRAEDDDVEAPADDGMHVPKKRKKSTNDGVAIPKKKKKP